MIREVRRIHRLSILFAAFFGFFLPALAAQESRPAVERFDHEHILGTSMRLETAAGDTHAAAAEKAVLAEIERLRLVLSTWDPASEISKLSAAGAAPIAAGDDLRRALTIAEDWMKRSKGAFQPAVRVAMDGWKAAEAAGKPPADSELAAIVKRMPAHLWKIDAAQKTVERLTDLPVTIDAFAKGYIIDAAIRAAKETGAKDLFLSIGGDSRTLGERRLAIADPHAPADNARPLGEIVVKNAAVATSAGYARGFDIGGRHYSHIIDPRTARPVEKILQATVIAPDAATADILATIANVLPPDESLLLIQSVPGAEALIIDIDRKEHASKGFAKIFTRAAAPAAAAASAADEYWPDGAELRVSFEIQKPAEGGGRGGYRRPYVAAWVEDAEGKPVATLCLWVERDRWIPDLRRWGRLYDGRYDDVLNVTRATRAPGKYDVVWEGRNDLGGACTTGTYTVFIEAVREHGTYQVMQQKITIDGKEKSFDLKGGVEIKSAKVTYVPPQKKG